MSQPRFPLLFKFLDAHRTLSVQVHPNDAAAGKLDPPDLGKTEAWVVLAAEPGSKIYAGLKRGFDRALLERDCAAELRTCACIASSPRSAIAFSFRAGTVHALGAGLLVAEIQQASDTTFRLFDWNRVGADGQPRPLHVAAALDAIDYDLGPVDARPPTRPSSRTSAGWSRATSSCSIAGSSTSRRQPATRIAVTSWRCCPERSTLQATRPNVH